MYNNGGASVVTGGSLAITGVSSLQIVGLAIIALGLCITGLLMLRSYRLRAQHQAD